MQSEKIVSVAIPVYNGEAYLELALQTLVYQDYPFLEIIIADNCSTDKTPEICQKFRAKDKRIRYIRNDTNLGALVSFNNLISEASGDYFMWLASDDMREPSFISGLVKLLEDPSVSIAFCIPNAIDEQGIFLGDAPKFKQLIGKNTFDGLCRYILQGEIWGKANLIYGLMRRDQVLETKGIRMWGWGEWGSDMHFVFLMLTKGKVALLDSVLFYKRIVGFVPKESEKPNIKRISWSMFFPLRPKFKAFVKPYYIFIGYMFGYVQIAFRARLNLFEKITILLLSLYRIIIYPIKYSN